MGKTNLDEFAMGNSTLSSYYGPTLNPLYEQGEDLVDRFEKKTFYSEGNTYLESVSQQANGARHEYLKPVLGNVKIDPQMRIVGGSSGGAAASVAADLVDFAIGSDTGGSVRLPACYTSTYGFKPTYGRISRWGLISYAQSLDTVGIISKRLDVIDKVFKVLDVYDSSDPTSMAESKRDRHANLCKKVRIGIPEEFRVAGMEPSIKKAWIELLDKLQESGVAEVYPVSVPSIQYSLPVYYTLVVSEASSNLSRFDGIRYGYRADEYSLDVPEFEVTRTKGFGEEVKRRITLGTFSLSSYGFNSHFVKATKLRSQLIDEFNSIFRATHPSATKQAPSDGVDFLLSPTAIAKPPLVSEFKSMSPVTSYLNDVMTVPASLAGLPTLNIPYGKSVGFQLTGQYGQDYSTLAFANRIQEWTSRTYI